MRFGSTIVGVVVPKQERLRWLEDSAHSFHIAIGSQCRVPWVCAMVWRGIADCVAFATEQKQESTHRELISIPTIVGNARLV
jgi:hypothetical protein